ncbi:MAG: hypothetical protein HXX19_09765 [Rhodoferax sp.]|nr:hypothetical protein [Rhodoferax sp.]
MRTLITHASPPAQQPLPGSLQLPHLAALLRLLTPGERVSALDDALSPLHEQLLAQAMGLAAKDGLVPSAALQARGLHLPAATPGEGWAWLTPCHWQVNSDHVRMADPLDSQISAEESHTVMETLRSYLQEDGIALHGLHDGNWLALGAVFHDLPTASLRQAAGGAVDHWLPRQPQARPLRRLQNEMQMLLYSHPVNDARAARGLLPINSFWVSGTGTLPADFTPRPHRTVDALREAALHNDTGAWLQAWRTLDNGAIQALLEQARRNEPVELTLCGDTAAQTFTLQPRGLWSRISQRFATTDITALLQSL